MNLKLNEISLTGYKSIGSEQKIPINDDVTVFIGANGVGKSNLISFFHKPAIGSMIAHEIGMDCLMQSCKHFADWIEKLKYC